MCAQIIRRGVFLLLFVHTVETHVKRGVRLMEILMTNLKMMRILVKKRRVGSTPATNVSRVIKI
jgi:hypothetical protein